MNRRIKNVSEDSVVTGTFGARVGYYVFGDQEQKMALPETILSRMLSTKSAISTESSLAQEFQRARDEAALRSYKSVGQGQCGTVYSLTGTSDVIKLSNSEANVEELYNDLMMHQAVLEAFASIPPLEANIHIPGVASWVDPSSDFWKHHASDFPQGAKIRNYGLLSTRIFPVPLVVREAIVDTLCPKEIQDIKHDFLGRPENKDCLVRLYLGRRNDTRKAHPESIRLANFPLHVDEMERLHLDTTTFAKTLAQALALLHWRAGVDGDDVEFVLGSSPALVGKPTFADLSACNAYNASRLYRQDYKHHTISVWLLDFNLCKKFTHDNVGLKRLVESFWCNDPYYPRPNSANANDKRLWGIFSQHYLTISAELTDSSGPKRFIDAVIEKGQ